MSKEEDLKSSQDDSPLVSTDPPQKKWAANAKEIAKELLMFVPSILVAIGINFYLLEQAKPFTPPEGYVFPREPVLEGIYRLEHHQGRNATVSYVGDTLVSCGHPSYYLATLVAHFGSYDCGFERELNGKNVSVELVRVPTKNKKVTDIVVRITHDGHDYRHVTDASIRDRWIVWTAQDAAWGAGNIWLALSFSQLALTYGRAEFVKFFKGVKKWLTS